MKTINITKGTFLSSTIVLMVFFSGCSNESNIEKGIEKTKNNAIEKSKVITEHIGSSIEKGIAVECVNTLDSKQMKSFIEKGNVRSEMTINGKKQIIVVKDGTTYSWYDGEENGQKMDKVCLDDLKKYSENMTDNKVKQPEEKMISVESLKKDENAGKIKCSPTKNVDFSIPSNIKFIDQCQMVKQQMQQIKERMKKYQL